MLKIEDETDKITTNGVEMFSTDDVNSSSLAYFKGDQLAADSFRKKYALRDKDGNFLEKNPDDMHRRLASEFHRIDNKFKALNNDACIYSEDEYFNALKDFNKVVPQGSPMMAIGNDFKNVSASNCFVIDAESFGDSIGGLFMVINEAAEIMKRRGGVGIDVSVYRPMYTTVNNAAEISEGVPSICDAISYFGRYIGQQGRQGALMLTISDRHPDIIAFTKMKSDLKKVTGANVSIRVSNDLIAAVKEDRDWDLQWPVNTSTPKITKTVKAREIWDEIVQQAWGNGEPGLLMWDNYCENLPAHCYKEEGFTTLTTNPCSEIGLSAYDSCRLISINLLGFVTNKHKDSAKFTTKEFIKYVEIAMQMEDNLVELEIEIIDKILANIEKDEDEAKLPYSVQKNLWNKIKDAAVKGRRTGLGTHGLADCLSALGLEYGSAMSLKVVDSTYRLFRDTAYSKSVDMAKDRGAFPVFDFEKEKNCAFIKRLPDPLVRAMSKYGRRNISLLTCAPTGTVSLLSQTSSGIEPVYDYAYIRKRKLLGEDHVAHHSINNGDRYIHYAVIHHELLAWAEENGFDKEEIRQAVIDNSVAKNPKSAMDVINKKIGGLPPQWKVTAQTLDARDRLNVVSIIQQYIDHGISQTCNFPSGTSKEEVEKFYIKAAELGLKGVTVYIDGSRHGVLTSSAKQEKKVIKERPTDIDCNVHRVNGSGLVLVGHVDNVVHEIFVGNKDDLPVPTNAKDLKIRRLGSRAYALVYPIKTTMGQVHDAIIPIRESFTQDEGMAVRLLTNLSIRSGIDLEVVVETLMKSADITHPIRWTARVLSNYVKNAKMHEGCCDAPNIVYEDGCKKCRNCDWSKCS